MFNDFVDRMDRWLKQKTSCAVEMFKKIDTEGEGIISYSLFKSGKFLYSKLLTKQTQEEFIWVKSVLCSIHFKEVVHL